MSVTPRGMSVQEAYREYRDGNFRVDRRYQRKLVWTLEEKRKLIDSLLHDFPIPLFLLAVSPRPTGGRTYDILDGMQRLNAIFSFIENAFSLSSEFFDVDQLARAKQLAQQGIFGPASPTAPRLSPAKCANLLDYQLAVTEFPGTNDEAVNEVFGRINSFGRHLSDQERRQAGVVTPFADTVREIAAEIRGDVSTDSLDLADMPEISIDIGGETLGYGIIAADSFWCKQGILRRNQLRESEDEQFLADLLISIVEEQAFAFSGKRLDAMYDASTAESRALNDNLVAYGTERLKTEVLATFSIIRSTIESADNSPNALRRIVHPGNLTNPIKTAFYAVFMAFFDLCIREEKAPADNSRIMAALRDLQPHLNVSSGAILSAPRQQNIDLTKGLIQNCFEPSRPPAVTHGSGTIIQFENAVRRSKVETAAFECKQGLLRLDTSRREQPGLLDRIVETLCGTANIGPASSGVPYVGAVFIGVADNEADKGRIEQLDGVTAVVIGSRYCVGVDRELPHLSVDLEQYKRKVVSHIASSGLSQPLKTGVLSSIDCITYKGHSVIALWVPPQQAPSTVSDTVFVREGSSTKRADGYAQLSAVVTLFQRRP